MSPRTGLFILNVLRQVKGIISLAEQYVKAESKIGTVGIAGASHDTGSKSQSKIPTAND